MEKPSLVTDKTNSVTELPFSMTDRPSLLMEIPLFVMDLTKSVMELPLSMTNKTKFMKEIPLSVMELPLLLNNQCPSVTDKGLSVVKFSQLEAEFDDFNEKTAFSASSFQNFNFCLPPSARRFQRFSLKNINVKHIKSF